MKLFDKQGKLFGKINLFDLIIISFVILTMSFLMVNKMFYGKLIKRISDVPELEYVEIDIVLPEDLTWMKEHINVDDVWHGLFHGKHNAKILDVREVDGFGKNKRLLVKIKAFVSKDRLGALSFGKHALRIGEEIIFYTPEYKFKGHITNINMTGEKIEFGD